MNLSFGTSFTDVGVIVAIAPLQIFASRATKENAVLAIAVFDWLDVPLEREQMKASPVVA
jgi:hypothetical protein